MMTFANITKSALICIIVAATMLVNIDDNLLARIGLSGNYLFLSLGVLLMTVFSMGINTFIIAVIIVFSMNTNMPIDFALNFGVDRDIYAIGMLILLISSFSWTMIRHQVMANKEEQLSQLEI